MKSNFIEVTNAGDGGGINWGKFLLMQFGPEEYSYKSVVDKGGTQSPDIPVELRGIGLLRAIGWDSAAIWVLDLQTQEGAAFHVTPRGYVAADLDKHRIWVCPMYEPFLNWLYKQTKELRADVTLLPSLVKLTEEEAPSAMSGYRRGGK